MAVIQHLYLHIPFCHRRCSYCSFNTYANMDDRMAAYTDALCREIEARGSTDKEARRQGDRETIDFSLSPRLPVSPSRGLTRADLLPTVFFGGGTPTMLPLDQLERILRAADRVVPLDGAEVTLEANPGTVLGRDYLRALRDMGVNRISMGVQSLHDPTLRVLGRIHTAAEARASFEDARAAGFERINLDFIFGLPGQTVEQWDAALQEISTWGADHFSLYSLILEEGTPLHAQVLGGRMTVPDDDATGEMYEIAMARLAEAGYQQYEISNWAKDKNKEQRQENKEQTAMKPSPSFVLCSLPFVPSEACHHNLAYWLNADYLACGAGAHGHVYPRRYHDVLGIDEYIRTVQSGALPTAEIIDLDERDLQAETMFMGLRLNAGVSYAHFRDRCGVELADVYGATCDELIELGLLERDAIGVRLTERGRMLGNQVFMRFVD
ncbi:MAG TPA: radical SAM family heme chaperone HemW [Roseiflexaceae bacterium]|nr:radical SAM family heme chaperone HemW [Roseiflexaceae bacterium]